jgi:hypothetical protein
MVATDFTGLARVNQYAGRMCLAFGVDSLCCAPLTSPPPCLRQFLPLSTVERGDHFAIPKTFAKRFKSPLSEAERGFRGEVIPGKIHPCKTFFVL